MKNNDNGVQRVLSHNIANDLIAPFIKNRFSFYPELHKEEMDTIMPQKSHLTRLFASLVVFFSAGSCDAVLSCSDAGQESCLDPSNAQGFNLYRQDMNGWCVLL